MSESFRKRDHIKITSRQQHVYGVETPVKQSLRFTDFNDNCKKGKHHVNIHRAADSVVFNYINDQ